jgi:flotillin
MGNVVVGAPNKAIIVSGARGQRINVGGCSFVLCGCEQWGSLSLEMVTLTLESNECESKQGVQVSIRSVAQIKILANKYEVASGTPGEGRVIKEQPQSGGGLQRSNTSIGFKDKHGQELVATSEIDLEKVQVASQHFLGMEQEDIEDKIREMMEGHQRVVIGTLTVEELYKDREKFSAAVRKHVNEELNALGFCLLSYTVQRISDKDGYMQSLGETQLALMKRQAQEGISRHENEARQKIAQFESEAEIAIARANREAHVHSNMELAAQAESDRDLAMNRAEAARIINKANEEAEAMTRITRAEQRKIVIVQQTQQQEEEAKVMVQVTEQEMMRAKNESAGHSEAELLQKQNRSKGVQVESKAASQSAQMHAGAAARVIKVKGEAEADVMKLKADAFKEYGQAAVVQQVINQLPLLCEKIAGPISKTDKITYVSWGKKRARKQQEARVLGSRKQVVRQVVPGLEEQSEGKVEYRREMEEQRKEEGQREEQQQHEEEQRQEQVEVRKAEEDRTKTIRAEEEARKQARMASIKTSKQRNSVVQMRAQRAIPAEKNADAAVDGASGGTAIAGCAAIAGGTVAAGGTDVAVDTAVADAGQGEQGVQESRGLLERRGSRRISRRNLEGGGNGGTAGGEAAIEAAAGAAAGAGAGAAEATGGRRRSNHLSLAGSDVIRGGSRGAGGARAGTSPRPRAAEADFDVDDDYDDYDDYDDDFEEEDKEGRCNKEGNTEAGSVEEVGR